MKCRICSTGFRDGVHTWREATVFLRLEGGTLVPACDLCLLQRKSFIVCPCCEVQSLEDGMSEWGRQCEVEHVKEIMES